MATSPSNPFDCPIMMTSCDLILIGSAGAWVVLSGLPEGQRLEERDSVSALSMWASEDEVLFKPPSLLTLLWTAEEASYTPEVCRFCPIKGARLRQPRTWTAFVAQVRTLDSLRRLWPPPLFLAGTAQKRASRCPGYPFHVRGRGETHSPFAADISVYCKFYPMFCWLYTHNIYPISM